MNKASDITLSDIDGPRTQAPSAQLAQSWFRVCLLFALFAFLTPSYRSDLDAWLFMWDYADLPLLRIGLPLGLTLCALIAWWTRNTPIRVLTLLPITTLASIQAVFLIWQMAAWTSTPRDALETALEVGLPWVQVMSAGTVAAMAFRIRRGLLAGRPHSWMVVAALLGLACIATTVYFRGDTIHHESLHWWYVIGGGIFLLLGLSVGVSHSHTARRALSLLSRVLLSVMPWAWLVADEIQSDVHFEEHTVELLRAGIWVALQYLSAALFVVLSFEWRYDARPLADDRVFE